MANKFKTMAETSMKPCTIMVGREPMTTDEVVNRELTVVAFGFAPKFDSNGNVIVDEDGVVDEYGVVIFAEEPEKYYGVGKIFTSVCKLWAADYTTAEEASKALAEEGGVKVKFYRDKTKKGNNVTKAEIL